MNIIFGASGFAKEVDWLISDIQTSTKLNYEINYFVCQDGSELIGNNINKKNVISETNFFSNINLLHSNCFIAISNSNIRENIYFKLISLGINKFPNLVHPSVNFDRRDSKIQLDEGVIICSGVILTTDISIKRFVHINIGSTIGHDSVIDEFTTISPGVHISGNVSIGKKVFIGTGAVILENISICDTCIIGAGSIVNKSIYEPGTYLGVPARKIK